MRPARLGAVLAIVACDFSDGCLLSVRREPFRRELFVFWCRALEALASFLQLGVAKELVASHSKNWDGALAPTISKRREEVGGKKTKKAQGSDVFACSRRPLPDPTTHFVVSFRRETVRERETCHWLASQTVKT